MDQSRFDEAVKAFARGNSRRSVIKGTAGGALAGLLALAGRSAGAAPECRRRGDACSSSEIGTQGRCCEGLRCEGTTAGGGARCIGPNQCECPAGESCINFECCPNNQICGGVCLDAPCSANDCEVCDTQQGACVSKCSGTQTCNTSTGTCEGPNQCECPAGESCINFECCPNNQVCGGVCLDAPCSANDCEVCDTQQGACVSRCSGTQTCNNGTCEGVACGEKRDECSATRPCCEGLRCQDGLCVGDTGIGESCLSDICERGLRCCSNTVKGPGGICVNIICKDGFREQGGYPNGPRCECCANSVCSARNIRRIISEP